MMCYVLLTVAKVNLYTIYIYIYRLIMQVILLGIFFYLALGSYRNSERVFDKVVGPGFGLLVEGIVGLEEGRVGGGG